MSHIFDFFWIMIKFFLYILMNDNSDTELCNMIFCVCFHSTLLSHTQYKHKHKHKAEENFPSPPFTCSPQPTYTLYIQTKTYQRQSASNAKHMLYFFKSRSSRISNMTFPCLPSLSRFFGGQHFFIFFKLIVFLSLIV